MVDEVAGAVHCRAPILQTVCAAELYVKAAARKRRNYHTHTLCRALEFPGAPLHMAIAVTQDMLSESAMRGVARTICRGTLSSQRGVSQLK